jgi:hypothetical protein
MCTTNEYELIYPDGQREKQRRPSLCPESRSGRPCANNVIFRHPKQYVAYGTQLPPTPTYTPRSNTPLRASGDESDRSGGGYHSAASSSSRRSRGSATQQRSSVVYVNGKKVYDAESSHRRGGSNGERIVLVEGPPTPRTPPQAFAAPHTAPSSPSMPYIIDASNRRESSSRRHPVIVDERRHRRASASVERPRVQIEVVDASPRLSSSSSSRRHARHSSSSSYESEEAQSRRREERELRRQERRRQEHQDQKDARLRDRIAAANSKIASRPAVPMPPQPILKRSSTSTTAATAGSTSASFSREREAELVDAVHRLDLEDQARRTDKAARRRERDLQKQQDAEDAAQRQRLRERMMPRRRATVGPGSRRPHVEYGDGLYRYE